jgi:hypothetical protein
MRWKSHVRFGERAGETDQPRGWHRAPARLHSRVRFPVMVTVFMVLLLSCVVLTGTTREPGRRGRNGCPQGRPESSGGTQGQ